MNTAEIVTKKNVSAADRRNVKKLSAMKSKDNIVFSLMSAPAVILVFIFSYIPMFGIILAFKNYNYHLGILKSKWVGLKNFEFFFKSNDAMRVTWNTITLNFTFMFVGLAVSVIVALMLYEVHKRFLVKFYQTSMLLPHFLSMVIVAYIVYAFLNPNYGFINTILRSLNIEEVSWYTQPKPWPLILLTVSVWKGFGMGSVVYYAALVGINKEFYEAAQIDGATSFQQVRYISIPFLLPIITIYMILDVGKIFHSDFGLFYQVTRDSGALYPTTDVIDTYVFRALRAWGDIGMSAAIGFFQSIVGFILVMVTNKIVKKIQPENALF